MRSRSNTQNWSKCDTRATPMHSCHGCADDHNNYLPFINFNLENSKIFRDPHICDFVLSYSELCNVCEWEWECELWLTVLPQSQLFIIVYIQYDILRDTFFSAAPPFRVQTVHYYYYYYDGDTSAYPTICRRIFSPPLASSAPRSLYLRVSASELSRQSHHEIQIIVLNWIIVILYLCTFCLPTPNRNHDHSINSHFLHFYSQFALLQKKKTFSLSTFRIWQHFARLTQNDNNFGRKHNSCVAYDCCQNIWLMAGGQAGRQRAVCVCYHLSFDNKTKR